MSDISVMVKNVDTTGCRVVVRGEVEGRVVFHNYLDDDDCVVELLRPGVRLIVELESDHK